MSKRKKTGTPHYEMLYIISNKFTEEEAEAVSEKINALVADKGGQITYSENWGKKKLAYRINGFSHGYYRLIEFDLAGEKLNELNNTVKLSSDIIRHQIVSQIARSAEEIAKEKEESKKLADATAKENKKKEKEEIKPREKEREKEKAKPKVDLKDLDEKLDKILETDNIL